MLIHRIDIKFSWEKHDNNIKGKYTFFLSTKRSIKKKCISI